MEPGGCFHCGANTYGALMLLLFSPVTAFIFTCQPVGNSVVDNSALRLPNTYCTIHCAGNRLCSGLFGKCSFVVDESHRINDKQRSVCSLEKRFTYTRRHAAAVRHLLSFLIHFHSPQQVYFKISASLLSIILIAG